MKNKKKNTWQFTEVKFAIPGFLALDRADIHVLSSYPGLYLLSVKENSLLKSPLADVFYVCALG